MKHVEMLLAAQTILIVDDEANQRLLLGEALSTLGTNCQVLRAASAAEALGYLAREAVSLLITDYQMPAMTGLELVASLRARESLTPVILISAYNLDEVQALARALQIEHVLVKPFPIQYLRRLAGAMLSSSSKGE